MAERLPFYKKPLGFSVEAPGLTRKMTVDFNSCDAGYPIVNLNGQTVSGEVVLIDSHHQTGVDGVVRTQNAKISFHDGYLNRRVEFDLVEFAPFFTAILSLGNIGIMTTSEWQVNLIKMNGPFKVKSVDGKVLKTALGQEIIDTESTYDKVTIKREKRPRLLELASMIMLVARLKKASKSHRGLVTTV